MDRVKAGRMETTKDKRVKREIANSNERRRMQSINAGFQKLKRLLPVNDGEKLSKAAILQHAAEFIQQIDRDKLILYEQNTRLRGTLLGVKAGTTPLETIDLDSLPTIPIITRLASINCSQVNNNSAGQQHNSSLNNSSSSTENSNDYCSSSTTNKDPNSSTPSLSCKQLTGKDVNNKTSSNHQHPLLPHQRHTAATNTTRDLSISSAANDSTRSSSGYQELHTGGIGQTTNAGDIISDRVTSPSGLVPAGSGGVAKAAIALPLEVPYTLETAIRHHDLHQQPPMKMVKTETLATIDPQEPTPKGQNLDTICKAIMEIEGDRVFTNENIKQPDLG